MRGAENLGARGGAQRAVQAASFLGIVANHLDTEGDFLLGIWNRLALLVSVTPSVVIFGTAV